MFFLPIAIAPDETIKTSLFLDCKLAKRELSWKPKFSLENGIDKTVKWYKSNLKIK